MLFEDKVYESITTYLAQYGWTQSSMGSYFKKAPDGMRKKINISVTANKLGVWLDEKHGGYFSLFDMEENKLLIYFIKH